MRERGVAARRNEDLTVLFEPKRIVSRTETVLGPHIDLNQPIKRCLGGYTVYFSLARPFAVERNGQWEENNGLVLLKPHEDHRLRQCQGLMTILLEPESVCLSLMQDERWVHGNAANRQWLERMEWGFIQWDKLQAIPPMSIDEMVFGEKLAPRQLDRRILEAVERIVEDPNGPGSQVEMLSASLGLSSSRLSHLFREQLDVPIRSFRAWKRIRQALAVTVSETILLHAAMAAGYADEAHYSRSMRKYFGLHAKLMKRHWCNAMAFRGIEHHQFRPSLRD